MLLTHNGEYATFKQWVELGGHIKKGEKSEIIVFWKIQPREEIKEDGTKEVIQVPMLRYYNVFHISQIEGVEPLELKRSELSPIESAEKVINDYVEREHIKLECTVSNQAYYSPTSDLVHLPLIEQFDNIEEYYSTAFHELTHSSGHKNRLNRINNTNLIILKSITAQHFMS